MKTILSVISAGIALVVFASVSWAESGTVHWHTGFQETLVIVTVAEGHLQGTGKATGITYNDAGSGPLHRGAGNCFYSFDLIDGAGDGMGFCTWSDADGDRIFTKFDGKLGVPEGNNGTNYITGGTGKYVGITGKGPWACGYAGSNGELYCNQSLTYELP